MQRKAVMKTHELANHVLIISKLNVEFGAQGPVFEPHPEMTSPPETLDAIEEAGDEALDVATWLIRCDINTLNRAGYNGNKIARRYRSLQAKTKNHIEAWQKAIEQVTALPIKTLQSEIKIQ